MKRQGFKRVLMTALVCLVAVVPCAAAIVNNSQVAGARQRRLSRQPVPRVRQLRVWVNMTLNTTSKTFVDSVTAGTVKNLNFNNLPFLTTKQIVPARSSNIYFNNNTYNGFTVTSNLTFAVASERGSAVGLARDSMPLS